MSLAVKNRHYVLAFFKEARRQGRVYRPTPDDRHGPLRPGELRWSHAAAAECAVISMAALGATASPVI